jgi:hypothetical protein
LLVIKHAVAHRSRSAKRVGRLLDDHGQGTVSQVRMSTLNCR